jgi:bifunctional DNA-binding transcriptional regulator/antitoxin component of YhaV-PrlF toxin-antitoxin module
MVKIKEYKIGKRGLRGHAITVPKVWVDDNRLTVGDKIEFYRDEEDQLILIPRKNK